MVKFVVYFVNFFEKDYICKKNKYFFGVVKWIQDNVFGDFIIFIFVVFEECLICFEIDEEVVEEEKKVGVQLVFFKFIVIMCKVFDFGSFFIVGFDEVCQWIFCNGIKVFQVVGVIYIDFEKIFIQVIVFKYVDFKEFGDEVEVRFKGKIMIKGKDYIVEDGDILYFKVGVVKS